jgi:hypothetical protein
VDSRDQSVTVENNPNFHVVTATQTDMRGRVKECGIAFNTLNRMTRRFRLGPGVESYIGGDGMAEFHYYVQLDEEKNNVVQFGSSCNGIDTDDTLIKTLDMYADEVMGNESESSSEAPPIEWLTVYDSFFSYRNEDEVVVHYVLGGGGPMTGVAFGLDSYMVRTHYEPMTYELGDAVGLEDDILNDYFDTLADGERPRSLHSHGLWLYLMDRVEHCAEFDFRDDADDGIDEREVASDATDSDIVLREHISKPALCAKRTLSRFRWSRCGLVAMPFTATASSARMLRGGARSA